MKNKVKLVVYICLMCIFICVMFLNIGKKEGFHEDEIFSYGASNSKYNSILLNYGKVDSLDYLIKRHRIFETLKNVIYYRLNSEEYDEKTAKYQSENSDSVWRTREDANEVMKIDSISEALDFFTVYWNTSRDVHPPLFYFVVHIVSILFFNSFSKYIIFYINLLFFLATCVVIIKIMKKLDKEHAAVPALILYGLSSGAISTVMFQRMYMMLTFFTLWFLYTNLKIYYSEFKLDKKLKIELCAVTVLGFLTQYYFCIYAAFLAFIMILLMIIDKKKAEIKSYIWQFIKSAIIGVLLFVYSISHIFFSYRGIGGDGSQFTFLNKLIFFMKDSFGAFGLQNVIGIVLGLILVIAIALECRNKEKRNLLAIFIVPLIFYIIAVSKLSPYKSLRYIMNILPLIAILIIYILDNVLKNKKISMSILTILVVFISLYGLKQNNVEFLYTGYNEYLQIAEEYKDDRFVMISTSYFNHIANIQEMMTYKESLILMKKDLEQLKNHQELKDEEEFILSIRTTMKDKEKVLQDVLDYTGFSDYELLHDSNDSIRYAVYKIYNK